MTTTSILALPNGSNNRAELADRASPDVTIHTDRAFDSLTPNERDQFANEIELDFRRYLAEISSKSGFVYFPSTRQIMKALSSLYQTLAEIDFSDIGI